MFLRGYWREILILAALFAFAAFAVLVFPSHMETL